MSWSHRPALDGLRTVAVYLVVLFHSGVAWFDGGFLGVDLFFVLSGFLVSSILLDEIETTGRLRLGNVYGRRVRRLPSWSCHKRPETGATSSKPPTGQMPTWPSST